MTNAELQNLVPQLRDAAARGDSKPFKALVEAGATDMMFWASERGEVEIIRHLLDAGASPKKGEMKLVPLAIAAEHGHAEIARLLIDAGADVNFQGLTGTPLA